MKLQLYYGTVWALSKIRTKFPAVGTFQKLSNSFVFIAEKGNILWIRDGPLFLSGGGVPFLGLADNLFLKSNAFQTVFFITFCNENNFFYDHFKKSYRLFIDLI